MLLNKDQLLGHDSRKTEECEIEALQGTVMIREMSTNQRLKIAEYNDKGSQGQTVAYMLAHSLIDSETGEPLMDTREARTFMDLHGAATDEIIKHITRVNGLDEDSLETAEKN